jgi:hypothetical protein
MQSNVKTVNFRTNYNNKLACPYFIHLDVAPARGSVTDSILDTTLIVISTMDGSHPPVRTKLYDLSRFALKDLHDNLALLSHGMTRDQFLDIMLKKKGVTADTELAVYFYHQVEASS